MKRFLDLALRLSSTLILQTAPPAWGPVCGTKLRTLNPWKPETSALLVISITRNMSPRVDDKSKQFQALPQPSRTPVDVVSL